MSQRPSLGVSENQIFSILRPSARRQSLFGNLRTASRRYASRSIDFLHLYFRNFFLQQLSCIRDLSSRSFAALPTFYNKVAKRAFSASVLVCMATSSLSAAGSRQLVISIDSCRVGGRVSYVRLLRRRFCLLRRYRTKVTGTWRSEWRSAEGSSWMGVSVQNLSLGNSMGQRVEMESLGREVGGEGAPLGEALIYNFTIFYLMFILDFKPQFLNYPLDPQEYARVTLRAHEVTKEITRLHNEIAALHQQPDRERYAHYIARLKQKAAVLGEEQHQCQQVVALHLAIDGEAHRHRQHRPEIKNKMLEHYKSAIAAKKSTKIMERMREVELERKILEGEEKLPGGSRIIRPLKIEQNPEKRLIFARFEEPTPNLLRFRSSQPAKKQSDSRKSSLNKDIRLPQIGKGLPPVAESSHQGLLVMSSPMRFSNFEISETPQLKLPSNSTLF